MFSFFALLFKASYWRTMFRGATWRETWMSLRRAHKDKRARKHLWQMFLLLLAPVLCLVYALWVIGSGPFMIVLILAIFAFLAVRRMIRAKANEKDAEFRELSADELKSFREYLADLALIYAVVLDRAGSERYVRTKELPEGLQVTTRRVHLELLKSRGVGQDGAAG